MGAPNNPPAFPQLTTTMFYEDTNSANHAGHLGMTLRDWFAGQALPFALERDYGNDWGKSGAKHIPYAVSKAYAIADAMLAERERRP